MSMYGTCETKFDVFFGFMYYQHFFIQIKTSYFLPEMINKHKLVDTNTTAYMYCS